MKIFLKIFLLMSLLISTGIKSQEQKLVEEGNKFYQEENYKKALEAYSQILKQGYTSSELHYNLGNTYYRLGKIGKSILNYERALKIEPENEDTKYNLNIANAHTIDKIKELPKIFIIEWWYHILNIFSLSGWSFLLIVINLLFLLTIAGYFFTKNYNNKKIFFYSGFFSFFILLFTVIIFISKIEESSSYNYAILINNTVVVKTAPDAKSNDAFIIHEGIKFSLEDQLQDWAKIKLSDGKVGWIKKDTFEKI